MAEQYRYSLEKIKPLARGRWLSILPALSGGSIRGDYKESPCPVCGGTDRFRLMMMRGNHEDSAETGTALCRNCGAFPDGFDLLRKIHGWSLPWALQQVAEYIGGGACPEPVARDSGGVAESRGISPEKQDARRKAIGSILAKCQREPGDIHRAYFHNRGIAAAADIRSGSLLYHPGLPYYVNGKPLLDGKGGWKTWAAIVGRVSSSSGWLGLQRIYLTKDGQKADEEIRQAVLEAGLNADCDSKPMLSINGMVGGAVRLGKAGKVLAVGEGLETMLAVSIGLGGFMSVAAAGTAALLEGMEIPEQVETLLIFADKDANGRGEQAAIALKSRVSPQMDVRIILPSLCVSTAHRGVDWLNELSNDASALSLMKNEVII
jgi:putative DNA primase/helicase